MDFKPLSDFLSGLAGTSVPGADCAVNYKGRRVFRESFGFGSVEKQTPVSPDALYNMYSMSKVVTCAAAMQLYEKGAFLLSDPVYEYIPEFRNLTVRHKSAGGGTEILPCARPATVRDLFTMSAGFTYNLNTPSLEELKQKAKKGGGLTTADFIAALLREPLAFEPGTHWCYSLCHDVLGYLIETVSGRKFGEYLKEHIFDAAGMKDTFFRVPAEKRTRFAAQYRYDSDTKSFAVTDGGNGFQPGDSFESGGAGLVSCVEDYSLFAEAMRRGKIINPKTADLMRRNQLDGVLMSDYRVNDARSGYGYGLGVRTMMDPSEGCSFSSPGEYGWGGAAGSYLLIDPARELSVVYIQHMLNPSNAYVHPRLRNIIYACLS